MSDMYNDSHDSHDSHDQHDQHGLPADAALNAIATRRPLPTLRSVRGWLIESLHAASRNCNRTSCPQRWHLWAHEHGVGRWLLQRS